MKIGIGELVIVFVIALVVIGPDKLPEYARQLGKALSELRRSTAGLNDEIKKDVIAPLNEAAKPLKEAVEPLNETVSDIKNDMQKVSKTLDNPAAVAKEMLVAEEKREEATETVETENIESNIESEGEMI